MKLNIHLVYILSIYYFVCFILSKTIRVRNFNFLKKVNNHLNKTMEYTVNKKYINYTEKYIYNNQIRV